MTTAYPGAIDTFANPTAGNNLNDGGVLHADQHANINDAVHAIEVELGINPSDVFTDVKTRLDALLPTISPRINDWVTAPDIKAFATNSNQTRSSGIGPWLAVPVLRPMTVDALVCQVDTAEAASTIRLGLYSTDSLGFATVKLGDVSVSGASTGLQSQTFGSPIVLTPGIYALVARVSSLTTLRLRGVVPASHSTVGIGAIPINDNAWVVANFGTSSALSTPISTYSNDLPDHTALIGMRRSA